MTLPSPSAGCWITFDAKSVEKLGDEKLAVDLFTGLPEGWHKKDKKKRNVQDHPFFGSNFLHAFS